MNAPSNSQIQIARPPLWSWGAAVVLAGIILLSLTLLDEWVQEDYFDYPRLGAPASSAKPDLIVALGTSKTRCAFMYDDEMEVLLKQAGRPEHFVRMSHSAGTIDELAPALDALEKTPPKLLLIEADLLLYEPQVYRPAKYDEYRVLDLRQRIRQDVTRFAGEAYRAVVGQPDPDAIYLENTPASHPGCLNPDPRSLDEYFAALANRRASLPTERQAFLDHFARLKHLGVTVVMLNLPRRAGVVARFPAALAADAESARQALLASNLIVDSGAPPEIPDAQFLDTGHLANDGTKAYSRWFVDHLPALLTEAGHD